MMHRPPTTAALPIIAAAGLASAQPAIEVSADARRTVAPALAPTIQVVPSRSTEVPLPLAPDQEVTLRRQVGGVRIADMNADGFGDVVAVVFISNSFPPYTEFQDQIYYGGPDGIALTPGWLSDQATHTGDVAIGDLNNDGHPDVITSHGGGIRADNVRVYLGSPTGPSTAPAFTSASSPSAWGTAVALADIDGDHDLDIATTNQGLSPDPFRPNFIYQNTNGSFATQPAWISADAQISSGVAVHDVNHDGAPDLAVAKGAGFLSAIYLGTPGGLPETLPSITEDPLAPNATDANRNPVFADFDANGTKELFLNGDPGLLFNTTAPFLTPAGYATNPPFNSPQETRAFDIDSDGDLDLAEVHFADGRAHIYLNRNGVLDSTPTWTFDAPEVGNSLDFGDVNNDGAPDLVVGYSGNVSLRVFLGTTPAPSADINGNGEVSSDDLDLLLERTIDLDASGAFDFLDVLLWQELASA